MASAGKHPIAAKCDTWIVKPSEGARGIGVLVAGRATDPAKVAAIFTSQCEIYNMVLNLRPEALLVQPFCSAIAQGEYRAFLTPLAQPFSTYYTRNPLYHACTERHVNETVADMTPLATEEEWKEEVVAMQELDVLAAHAVSVVLPTVKNLSRSCDVFIRHIINGFITRVDGSIVEYSQNDGKVRLSQQVCARTSLYSESARCSQVD
jgi:hypothetical protein